jgi:hypothetical protein
MFEIDLAGERLIFLCRPELIENMNAPSTKTKYPIRLLMTEALVEYGFDKSGLINNNILRSWKYSRQFFSQSMMTPSFNNQAIEWSIKLCKEMESYWNNLGENYELDLPKWMRRFTNEIIFKISTGVKNNAVLSYYNTLIPNNNNTNSSLNKKEKEEFEKPENFVKSIETYIQGFVYFFTFNNFMRHNFPFVREKVKNLLKNRDYFFDRIHQVIKERRIEIENTPLDQPLRHDMLTSYITANTSRDINIVKHSNDADFLRPMTDEEIFGNIYDAMLGGTDTVSKTTKNFSLKKKITQIHSFISLKSIDGEFILFCRILSRT